MLVSEVNSLRCSRQDNLFAAEMASASYKLLTFSLSDFEMAVQNEKWSEKDLRVEGENTFSACSSRLIGVEVTFAQNFTVWWRSYLRNEKRCWIALGGKISWVHLVVS